MGFSLGYGFWCKLLDLKFWFRVLGQGLRFVDLGFWVLGLRFWFRVLGLGFYFRVLDIGFRVLGCGSWVLARV